MEDLKTVEMITLLDLLSQHTAKYSQMLTDGCDQKEFEKLKKDIEMIQGEIARRKNTTEEKTSSPGLSSFNLLL